MLRSDYEQERIAEIPDPNLRIMNPIVNRIVNVDGDDAGDGHLSRTADGPPSAFTIPL